MASRFSRLSSNPEEAGNGYYNGTRTSNSNMGFTSAREKQKDNITVAVRIRPLSQKERSRGEREVWGTDNAGTVGTFDQDRTYVARYGYDIVLGPGVQNDEVYQRTAASVVKCSVCQGINGTVFAYGVTSSGKTYSMMGEPDAPGIIPQAVDDMFNMVSTNPQKQYLIKLSMLEIYNELLYDLLETSRDGGGGGRGTPSRKMGLYNRGGGGAGRA